MVVYNFEFNLYSFLKQSKLSELILFYVTKYIRNNAEKKHDIIYFVMVKLTCCRETGAILGDDLYKVKKLPQKSGYISSAIPSLKTKSIPLLFLSKQYKKNNLNNTFYCKW